MKSYEFIIGKYSCLLKECHRPNLYVLDILLSEEQEEISIKEIDMVKNYIINEGFVGKNEILGVNLFDFHFLPLQHFDEKTQTYSKMPVDPF